MPDHRTTLLAAAFRDSPLSLGGRQLRRPTAGSIDLLVQIGNPLFAGVDDDADPDTEIQLKDSDAMRGVFEFAWLHSIPIEEIEALPLDPDQLTDHVRRKARAFGMGIEFDDLAEFSQQFAAVRARLESAVTQSAETGPGAPGKPGESAPTGLPAWSTPSVVPETPPASAGSSGSSPSSEPSNTTTPPASTTAPPAAGDSTPAIPAEIDPMPVSSS